jgi:hypothetical protein
VRKDDVACERADAVELDAAPAVVEKYDVSMPVS